MNRYEMQNTYLIALTGRVMAAVLLLNVPAEFWTQVMAVLEVPAPIREFVITLVGATCMTIAEAMINAKRIDDLRRAGKIDETYHDPTAKYWPGKIFVGTMFGLLCSSLIAPGVQAIIPGATPDAIGFIASAVGYWFLSQKLREILNKNQDEAD